MSQLIFVLIAFLPVFAFAGPRRFDIENQVTGLKFSIEREDGVLGGLQPEWGKPEYEAPCSEVPEDERHLIKNIREEKADSSAQSRDFETSEEVEICVVADHFKIVETDISEERELEQSRKQAREQLKQNIRSAKDIDKMAPAEVSALLKDLIELLKDKGVI